MGAGDSVDGRSLDGAGAFAEHPLRDAAVNELHARPFELISTPRIVHHFAALCAEDDVARDIAAIRALCADAGLPAPPADARHIRLDVDGWHLRWERHTEFCSHTWHARPAGEGASGEVTGPPLDRLPVAGQALVAVRLDLVADDLDADALAVRFDPSSLCLSLVEDGAARMSTDFKIGPDRLTRILIENRTLGAAAAGQLVQRVLEIETYRSLALLGFPEAVAAGPEISRIERELTRITVAMNEAQGLDEDHALLKRLTFLAAELEAQTSAMSFRLGAGRAYHHLVDARLANIAETAVSGHRTWTAFLARRMMPAMRTSRTVEERQEALSQRLSRAANLLRTRLDVERANQNSQLLTSMDRRARLQLRLQQTVEGLSVAAVSYYVVGLIGYLVKGSEELGVRLPPHLVTAAAVPVVVLSVWLLVRRIRRAHVPDGGP